MKLDTNGTKPQVLEKMIAEKAVDFFAMDIKTSLPRYKEIVGCGFSTEEIKKSKEIIKIPACLTSSDYGGKRKTYGRSFLKK